MNQISNSEYSDEYQKGYADGVESFRPKFEEITARIMLISCDGCVYYPEDGQNYAAVCGTCKRFYPDHFDFKG